MTYQKQCADCRYRGKLDGYMPSCDYSWITGRCRIRHIRPDGSCGVKEVGDPKHVDFDWWDQIIKPTRDHPMKYDGERMLELYNKGLSDGEIAKDVGCTPSAVRCWRRREGHPANVNQRPVRSKYDRLTFRLLYDQGLSDGQIARKLGCGTTTVATWRNKAGLKPNYEPFWAKKGAKDGA